MRTRYDVAALLFSPNNLWHVSSTGSNAFRDTQGRQTLFPRFGNDRRSLALLSRFNSNQNEPEKFQA